MVKPPDQWQAPNCCEAQQQVDECQVMPKYDDSRCRMPRIFSVSSAESQRKRSSARCWSCVKRSTGSKASMEAAIMAGWSGRLQIWIAGKGQGIHISAGQATCSQSSGSNASMEVGHDGWLVGAPVEMKMQRQPSGMRDRVLSRQARASKASHSNRPWQLRHPEGRPLP